MQHVEAEFDHSYTLLIVWIPASNGIYSILPQSAPNCMYMLVPEYLLAYAGHGMLMLPVVISRICTPQGSLPSFRIYVCLCHPCMDIHACMRDMFRERERER